MADITQTLKKLNLYKVKPDLVKDIKPNELADLVILVLKQVAVIETAIREGRLDAYTPQAGKDYMGKPEALTMLTNAVNDAVRDFDGKMAQKGSLLEMQVSQALENIRNGDNGIVSEEEIQRAAEMAFGLIELPDFAAMIPEAITADISAVRDGLELLIGDNRLQVEITDVKGLEESLQRLAQIKASTGGIGKNQVYGFIKQAIADGTISAGGGGITSVVGGTNVTIDNTDPDNPIISASVPGGSGITRSVNNIVGNTTAGSVGSTDYDYNCTGALTLTLPTAVGNTNKYSVTRISGLTTVATTSSQTINGSTTATLTINNMTLTFISDGANWNIK